jgi:hypothetical protein
MPNAGWKSFPDQREDAGGAWQSHFEKLALPGGNNEYMCAAAAQQLCSCAAHACTSAAPGARRCQLRLPALERPGGAAAHARLNPPPRRYTLIMQLPLTGPLAAGGLIFVLKSASGSQDTRWLKDSKSGGPLAARFPTPAPCPATCAPR